MERRIVRTADGSPTLQIPGWGEQYHSLHGAIRESRHVFIEQGLAAYSNQKVRILEMGFGTGLNALMTLLEAPGRLLDISYTSLEAYPVVKTEWEQLDYGSLIGEPGAGTYFLKLHEAPWGGFIRLSPEFELCKRQEDFLDFDDPAGYDLVYFDAFGARVQPELWTEGLFGRIFNCLVPGGRLTTYAAKGSVRRAMQATGFLVERLPGPPGKREMLRATRPL